MSDQQQQTPPVKRYAHGSRVPGWDEAADLTKDPAGVPDPATTPVSQALREEIEAAMAKYPDRRSAALPALAAAQREHGWCSPDAIRQAACVMRLTPGYLVSVATFYDMFDTVPVGRHRVYVCTNISCSLNGADGLYEHLERATLDDEDISVRHFECLGACDIAPMASVDGVFVGPIADGEADELIADLRAGRPPLERKQLVRRASTDPEANTRDWSASDEPVHEATADGSVPSPPTSYGERLPALEADAPGPPAAIENAPTTPDDDDTDSSNA